MFFQSIKKLLDGAEAVTVIMVPADDGRVGITVSSRLKEGANPALARPITLIGTPEELDAEFAGLMTSHAGERKSLAEQLASQEAQMKAAAAASKKTPAKSTAQTKPATPSAVSIDDLVSDDEAEESARDEVDEGVEKEAPAAPSVSGDGGLDLESLL